MDIRWRGLLVVAVSALGLGAFAPGAGAATVENVGGVLRFTATDGEKNTIRLALPTAAAYTITDVGIPTATPITPGAGCTTLTASSVSCPTAGLTSIEVLLGDQDDELFVVSADLPLTGQGGDGADLFDDNEVAAGTPTRSFNGGTGDDYMRASVTPKPLAHDYVGGDGIDWVDYNYRGPNEGGVAQAHTISLNDLPDDGAAAEGDNVHSDIERVVGSEGVDTITGTGADEWFVSMEGADVVDGGAGADRMWASLGCNADSLTGGDGGDDIFLGGNTKAFGGAGEDSIHTDPAPTQCAAGSFDDANGGLDRDEAVFTAVTAPVTVSLDNAGNDGVGGLDNFHDDIENLTAGGVTDGGVVVGTQSPVVFIGGTGPNLLTGGFANDRLDGRGGADQLRGMGGTDTADYSLRSAPVNLSLDDEDNDGEVGEGDGIWSDVENLRGGSGNDTLTGNGLDNWLDGGLGKDTITGGAGIDAVDYSARTAAVKVTLDGVDDDGEPGENDDIAADVEGAFGGQGADEIDGGAGGNGGFLLGNGGNDKISDGGGVDTINAGDGNDEVNSADGAADTVSCGAGTDKFASDTTDTVAADCEPPIPPVEEPEEPQQPNQPNRPNQPNQPNQPNNPTVPVDRTVPSAKLTVRKGQDLGDVRSAGLKLTVKVGEAARMTGKLTAERGTRGVLKRRGISVRATLGSGRGDLARAGSKLLTVKLTRQGRRALRGLDAARLKLVVTVTDRAGNKRTVTHHLRFS